LSDTPLVLVADDDVDDCELTEMAFVRAGIPISVRFVHDGTELLDYLLRRPPFTGSDDAPRPQLVLLDLNMPRMGGREALREIRNRPDLRELPVVILTTSRAEEDVDSTYRLGANSFISKPTNFARLVEAISVLGHYWFNLVTLPR